MEGCHGSVNLLDVPAGRTYRPRKKRCCTNRLILGLSIDNRISFKITSFFWMLIAQDTCSNENNNFVRVQQIFQKLKLYQNRVKLLIKSSDSRAWGTGGWWLRRVWCQWNPLLRVCKLKNSNIVRPTVSQLYIIYEYRIGWIGPKKHV